MILSNEAQERASLIVARLVALRRTLQGASEDDIARQLGFDHDADLRAQLRAWKLPEWLVTGDGAAEKPKAPKPPPRERKARSSGPAKELPPASNAASLFRERLEALIRATDELRHRKEKLQGGRFIQSSLYTDPHHYFRELFSDEQWEVLSEHYGFDPTADSFSTSDVFTWSLGGGTSTPEAPLPALIGAYLLAGGNPGPLVEALHPDPASAEWSKIEKRIEGRKREDDLDGIKALAEQLAKAIRGGTLRTGSPVAELSRHEINLASRITELREQGWSDEDIYQRLCSSERFAQELKSWENFQRLADLEVRYPFS